MRNLNIALLFFSLFSISFSNAKPPYISDYCLKLNEESVDQKLDRLARIYKSFSRLPQSKDVIENTIPAEIHALQINVAPNFPVIDDLENVSKMEIKQLKDWISNYPKEFDALSFGLVEIHTKYSGR